MAPITSRASNDRNVGTEAPNRERDAHGQQFDYCTADTGLQVQNVEQYENAAVYGAFRLDSAFGFSRQGPKLIGGLSRTASSSSAAAPREERRREEIDNPDKNVR